MIKRLFVLFVICLCFVSSLIAQEAVNVNEGEKLTNFGTKLYLLKDKTDTLTISDIIKRNDFKKLSTNVPNLGISNDVNWLKVFIYNDTDDPRLSLQIPLPTIDFVDFYQLDSNNNIVASEFMGDRRPYYSRKFDNPFSTFQFTLAPNHKTTIVLRIQGGEQLQVPLTLANSSQIVASNSDSFIIFGIYAGVICVMFIYNLFLS